MLSQKPWDSTDASKLVAVLGGSDLDTGAHGGSNGAGADILTLGSCGLSLHNSLDQSIHVLQQLLSAEGHLADGAVDDVGLVQTVLDQIGRASCRERV